MRDKFVHFYDPLYEVLFFGDLFGAKSLYAVFRAGSGQVTLQKSILPLIRCPEVLRLHWLSQAGFIPLVFPSGTHSRFSHALGTLHLGSIALNSVTLNFKDTNETKVLFDILRLKEWLEEFIVAAFLHDLGHYPFSHTLENNLGLHSILGNDFVSHEEAACQLIQGRGPIFEAHKNRYQGYSQCMASEILSGNGSYKKDIICYLISGDYDKYLKNQSLSERDQFILKVMHELISGTYDLDRIDHYRRDSFFTGLGHTFKPYVLLHGLHYTYEQGDSIPKEKPSREAEGQIHTLLFIRDQLHEHCFGNLRNISFGAMLNHALTSHLESISQKPKEEGLSILSMTDGELLHHLQRSESKICKEIVRDILMARPYPCIATFPKQADFSSRQIREKVKEKDDRIVLGFSKYYDKSDKPWLIQRDIPDAGKGYAFSLSRTSGEVTQILRDLKIYGVSDPDKKEHSQFNYLAPSQSEDS